MKIGDKIQITSLPRWENTKGIITEVFPTSGLNDYFQDAWVVTTDSGVEVMPFEKEMQLV